MTIIRDIINHQWLPKWPIIQWFSWKSLAPLEKVDLAVQGLFTLLYLYNKCLWMEAATDLVASTSTDKLSIFHCNLHPAQALKTIVFQWDDAPWNSTASLVTLSARRDTECSSLCSTYMNRHKARPDRSSTDQRVPAQHLLLNFLGKGLVIISRFFSSWSTTKLNDIHPFLHLDIGYVHSVGWSAKSLVWHKEQVEEGKGWAFRVGLSFQSPATAFLPKLSKKDAGWEWLGTTPPFRTESA